LRFSPLHAAATCRAYGLEGQVAARAEQELQQATAEMRRARSAYVAAHRGLRVVQRLEDKARTGHASACRLAEQAQLDELASLRRDHPVSWP
jgi:flagellar export protein FliJ